MISCAYCGGFANSADMMNYFCPECVAAHGGRACESIPGTCAVCDQTEGE